MLRRRKRAERDDPFGRSADERRAEEDATPWFLADDEAPDLDVEAGIGSNLEEGDLEA